MLRKSKALILCLMLCIGLLIPFDSKASGLEFYLDYAEPTASESNGYFTVLLRNNNTGAYEINTFFWYCVASASGGESPAYANITIKPTDLTFTIAGVGSATGGYYCLSQWNEFGRCSIVNASSSAPFTWSFSRWNRTCLAYKYSGNVGQLINSGVNGDSYPFSVYFDEHGSSILLQGILSALMEIRNLDSSILTTVNSILSSVDSVEGQLTTLTTYLRSTLTSMDTKLSNLLDKADRLIEEQEESNTWLEKIFNWLEDSPEQEKEAAQSQAGQSSSDAQASIEDKSAGFVDSVNGLASSMSYSGTQCAWTFPALYLPEIPGVMSRTQLTSEKPIDFAYWVNQIPSDVLLLVRSVLTIALIGYCFKEFYSVIEYVLTMRGGGNSE